MSAAVRLRSPLAWTIAWRFLRGPRSRLLDGTARAALLATALGVTAMVIAMALMTGYREDLQGKLIGGNAAVVAYPLLIQAGAVPARTLAELEAIPGVLKVGRVAYGQGSLAGGAAPDGIEVVLRGVDPGGGQLAARPEQLRAGADGIPGAVLGADLARRLAVEAGAVLRLVALGFEDGRPRFRYQSLRVADVFATGFAEFDRSWVVVERPLVERLMGAEGASDLLEFTVEDPQEAPRIGAAAGRVLGSGFLVSDWQQFNRELFAALRLQQVALFLVLGLIVLVSTFNVASTLVVLVRERMRDLGVLAALGLPPAGLRAVFLAYGGALGAVGTLLGVAAGAGSSWVLTRFELIRFDAEVAAIYFIRSVPFRVRPVDLVAVVVFALAVTLVACFAPAWRAARVDPSAALRYE
ncbi:MAG TPA: FtsX-like permease family protein [Thermoanaerobaculia bacterium]|nr:FtsX-like permease family protein [Thermoanaerobaculia bacterium]